LELTELAVRLPEGLPNPRDWLSSSPSSADDEAPAFAEDDLLGLEGAEWSRAALSRPARPKIVRTTVIA